jgi:hypothetical protein
MSDLVSSITSLQRFMDMSLTAETISEKLDPYPTGMRASALREKLVQESYDVAVLEDPESKRVHRYVHVEELTEGTCGDCAKPIPLEGTVAKATSLRDCLRPIVDHGRVFVLGRTGVEEIITRADLDKQPVRLFLFGVISTIEMAMLAMIRQRFPEERWREHLSQERLQKAREILEHRRLRNEEIDLADCLQVSDKVKVLLKDKKLIDAWGFGSKRKACRFFDRLQQLRNKLAHANDPASGSSWEDVVKTFNKAEKILKTTIELLE